MMQSLQGPCKNRGNRLAFQGVLKITHMQPSCFSHRTRHTICRILAFMLISGRLRKQKSRILLVQGNQALHHQVGPVNQLFSVKELQRVHRSFLCFLFLISKSCLSVCYRLLELPQTPHSIFWCEAVATGLKSISCNNVRFYSLR